MFKEPGLNNERANELNQGIRNKASEDFNNQKNQADFDTEGIRQSVENFDNTKLQKTVNDNYAKSGGEYGNINNRDYSTTLRLAREADAYNNRPMEHVERIGMTGVQDLGTGFDKPGIQTAETRATQQAMNLDTNQKQLAQALQAAVKHKDLDAFTEAYKQRFGITLSRYEAEREMTRYQRQMEQQQVLTKDYAQWNKEFGRHFTEDTSRAMYDLVASDPYYAGMLSYNLGLGATPSQYDKLMQDWVNDRIKQLKDAKVPTQKAVAQAYSELNYFIQRQNNIDERTLVNAQKLGAKSDAKKEANKIAAAYNKGV